MHFLGEETLLKGSLKGKLMRAIIFLSMPQTSARLADRHSPGIAVCLRAALSQSQGTSFVMFRTLEFCCSVCKGQRFRKTHTAREGGQEGWSQHWCRYFFPWELCCGVSAAYANHWESVGQAAPVELLMVICVCTPPPRNVHYFSSGQTLCEFFLLSSSLSCSSWPVSGRRGTY